MTDPQPLTPDPFLVTTSADLHRLAAEMRAHVAEHDSVAARVVCLGRQTFQLMLRPGPPIGTGDQGSGASRIPAPVTRPLTPVQLVVAGPGYRFPDAWLPDLRAAFGVPDGTLMVYDLVKRVHQVVKWTWTVDAPAEQLQMSFAGLEAEGPGENYYRRGRG